MYPEAKYVIKAGRIQSLKVSRDMSAREIRDTITHAFNISEYTVLGSDSAGHCLLKSCDQDIDGEMVMQRRGSLYLCENYKVATYFENFENLYYYFCRKHYQMMILNLLVLYILKLDLVLCQLV